MTTIAEALQYAADRFDAAAQLFTSLRDQIAAQVAANQQNVTTIINNFLGRPPVQVIWIDPVNGVDTNDGLTSAAPKKDLDAFIDTIGITATEIRLLGNATLRKRHGLYPSFSIYGVQPAPNNAYTLINRTVRFLGTAENSPVSGIGTFCSGLWVRSPNFFTQSITFSLPTQVAGQDYSAHINFDYGTAVSGSFTLLVDGPTAGALYGSKGNTCNASLNVSLGAGAAGHLLEGIAAGGDPNASFRYRSNITSA